MAADLVIVPRRGTPVFRAWLRRALFIGVLPILSIGLGVATLVVFDLAATGERPWTDLTGWLFAGLVLVGVIGLVALFDARTRVAGAFALLASLLVNPLTAALLLSLAGLS